MKKFLEKWKDSFRDKKFIWSLLAGFLFLILSLAVNYIASTYATEKASLPVTDIILSNIRVYDVDTIFVYGPLIFWLFAALVLALNPKKIPFTLKSIATFVVIRSIFISLTHIGPFPTQAVIDSGQAISRFGLFGFAGDLFFSGHTGLPFLMALIFWQNKYLRWIFTLSAVFFGVVVLMAHLHYTIDVLAAFFITYTIFHIAEFLFKRDRNLFFA